CARGSSTFDYW
nr:immunoglobulin heavy chain junction region [Mus musculus]